MHLIGTRSRYLPACSLVPQSRALWSKTNTSKLREAGHKLVAFFLWVCSSEGARSFEGIYCLCLQGQRVYQVRKQLKHVNRLQVSCLDYSLTLKLEAIWSSETWGFLRNAKRYNTENCNVQYFSSTTWKKIGDLRIYGCEWPLQQHGLTKRRPLKDTISLATYLASFQGSSFVVNEY
jgi:hypothetical protein